MVLRILHVPNKYDEVIVALVFGSASFGFGMLMYVVGSATLLSVPVILSTLMAWKYGRRVLRQADEGQRLLARVAMVAGVVGVLLYVNCLINTVKIYQRSLQPQNFRGYGLQFTYPGSWQPIDMSQIQACKVANLTCVLLVGQPDKTTMSVIQSPLVKAIQVDSALVQQHVQALIPNAHLTAQDTITVGGQRAGRVIFDGYYSGVPSGSGYFLAVEVANGLSLYSITVRAVNAENLAAHRGDIDNIISSITFVP